MEYDLIKQFDCGSLINPKFLSQEPQKSFKPLLTKVIELSDKFTEINNLPKVKYNIEIKSDSTGDNIFHPAPFDYVTIVLATINKFQIY